MRSVSTAGAIHNFRECQRGKCAPGRTSNSTAVVLNFDIPSANVGSHAACLSRRAGPSMAHNTSLIRRKRYLSDTPVISCRYGVSFTDTTSIFRSVRFISPFKTLPGPTS